MSKGFIITVIVIVVLAMGGFAYWYMVQNPSALAPALYQTPAATNTPASPAQVPSSPSAQTAAPGMPPAIPQAPGPFRY